MILLSYPYLYRVADDPSGETDCPTNGIESNLLYFVDTFIENRFPTLA